MKTLEEASILELKAAAWDIANAINKAQSEIAAINVELNRRAGVVAAKKAEADENAEDLAGVQKAIAAEAANPGDDKAKEEKKG